jgi:hypothetical protein
MALIRFLHFNNARLPKVNIYVYIRKAHTNAQITPALNYDNVTGDKRLKTCFYFIFLCPHFSGGHLDLPLSVYPSVSTSKSI